MSNTASITRFKIPNSKEEMWQAFQTGFYYFLWLAVIATLLYVIYITASMIGKASTNVEYTDTGMKFRNLIQTVHAIAAMPPLFLGLIAFNQKKRRNLKQHRLIGTWYVYGIWISSVTGVILASLNHFWLAKLGFGLLGIFWFITTTKAYIAVREKRIPDHRRWMIRSFSLTLAVVAVRPMFILPGPSFLEPNTWYILISWICWVPNLIAAEIYVRMTAFSGALVFLSKK